MKDDRERETFHAYGLFLNLWEWNTYSKFLTRKEKKSRIREQHRLLFNWKPSHAISEDIFAKFITLHDKHYTEQINFFIISDAFLFCFFEAM